MVAMILSRIIGYVRDMVIYARFGQNNLTDAYNAAFSIPDFLYLLVGGALSSALFRYFQLYSYQKETGMLHDFNIIIILMLVGIGLGIIRPRPHSHPVPVFPENVADGNYDQDNVFTGLGLKRDIHGNPIPITTF